jgi:hypothetical protein
MKHEDEDEDEHWVVQRPETAGLHGRGVFYIRMKMYAPQMT